MSAPQQPLQSPVHDRGTPSGHHGPDSPLGIQQSQLQACPTFGIQICNVGFLGTREQQVGPSPGCKTPGPLPFPWSSRKRAFVVLIGSGRRVCVGPDGPGTKWDAVYKHQNHCLETNFPTPFSLISSPTKSLASTLAPLPASPCLTHYMPPSTSWPGSIRPPSPDSSPGLGSVTHA